jgi:chemotaxis protein MotB
MGRKKQEGEAFNPLGWMLTFSDLVTLLLTFFVMLFAMRTPEVAKLKAAFGVFSGGAEAALGLTDKGKVGDLQELLDSIKQPRSDEFGTAEQELAKGLDLPPSSEGGMAGQMQQGVNLKSEERGVVITLANDLLFQPGQAALSPQAEQAIHQAATVLRHGGQPISVEGHTDSMKPGAGATAADNWSLSLQRALAVLHYLNVKERIPARRLRVAALGSTRPLVPNDTPEHRAMNRRTEIVLLMSNQ